MIKKLGIIIKQKRKINTLELRVLELEETISGSAYKEVMKAVKEIQDNDKLRKQNRRLRKQVKELKESLRGK